MGAAKKLGRARRNAARAHVDCGCDGLGNFAGALVCSCCTRVIRIDVWMPTAGQVGETRLMGTGCPACGSEVEGQVLIADKRDHVH